MSELVVMAVHGNVAQLEVADGLDPATLTVDRRGWGTALTDSYLSSPPDLERYFWIHLPIPTPLNLEGVVMKLDSVQVELQFGEDPGEVNAMHVWDGNRRLKHWDSYDDLRRARRGDVWPIDETIENGVGISLRWEPGAPFAPISPAQLTILGAHATFVRAITVDRHPG